MRVIRECEVHTIFEDGDEMPPEIMTKKYGELRRRMQPTSLVVKWQSNKDAGDWELSEVYLFGHQVHKTASNSFIHHLFKMSGPQWVSDRKPIVAEEVPEWVVPHIAMSHPNFIPTAIAWVTQMLYDLLGIGSPAN